MCFSEETPRVSPYSALLVIVLKEMSRFCTRMLCLVVAILPLRGNRSPIDTSNIHDHRDLRVVKHFSAYYSRLYEQKNVCSRIEKLVSQGGTHAAPLVVSPLLRSSNFEAARLTLLVSAFVTPEPNFHHLEIDEVMCANLANPSFAEVHVLLQGTMCPHFQRRFGSPAKMKCVEVASQPKYWDLFQYASQKLASRVVVLANGDILFDTSLQRLQPQKMNGSFAFVLSTDSASANPLYEYLYETPCDTWSHCKRDGVEQHSWDAFVFRSPLPWPVDSASYAYVHVEKLLHVVMNTPGAENRAAFALQLMGLRVLNACDHLHAVHWHCGPLTHNKAGYKRVYVPPPPNIKNQLTQIYHNIAAAQSALSRNETRNTRALKWLRVAQKRLRLVIDGRSSHIKTSKCLQDCPAINYGPIS